MALYDDEEERGYRDHYDNDFEEKESDSTLPRQNMKVNEGYEDESFSDEEDDDASDFFSGPDLPDPPKKKPKAPALKPDDPDYWDREESEWEHLLPRRSTLPLWMWLAASVIIIVLCIAFYLRFFSPYREAATQYGYIEQIETRGTIFKTIEGILLPYKNLMDTTRVYDHDFIFTVKDKKVAATIYSAMTTNKPVRVTYKEYSATVPWRGESKVIVTDAVPVDPANILPPDRRPATE